MVKILQYLNSLYNNNVANIMTRKLHFVTFWNFKWKRFKNKDIFLKEPSLNCNDVLLLPNQNKKDAISKILGLSLKYVMNFLDINSQVFFKDMVIMEALSVNNEMRTKSVPWSLFKH